MGVANARACAEEDMDIVADEGKQGLVGVGEDFGDEDEARRRNRGV